MLWVFFRSTHLASKVISLMNIKLPILCYHDTPQSSLSVGLSMHFSIVKLLFITYTKQQTNTKPSLSLQINRGQSAFSPLHNQHKHKTLHPYTSFKIVGFLKNLRLKMSITCHCQCSSSILPFIWRQTC
jgi:hypothetical protein